MSRCHSFPPVIDKHARVLVLGSMPGQASLQAQQYYAHPRNAFWKIMGELFDWPGELIYAERLQRLKQQHVALWDVMKACERSGSLDSAIDETSIEANDFVALFSGHPEIDAIFFNGAKAQQAFEKYVLPSLGASAPSIMVRLPSTSPAHAALRFEEKRELWSQVADVLGQQADIEIL